MFHKVKHVSPLPDFRLNVQFCEGVTKLYDMKPLFERLPVFSMLRDDPAAFGCVAVDVGGYGIIWDDELDLSCDELWDHGVTVPTPFDETMARGMDEARADKSRDASEVFAALRREMTEKLNRSGGI